MAIYPDIILDLKVACARYRRQEITEKQLQEHLWKAVQGVVALEEKAHRAFLRQAEGKIELLQFTVSIGELRNEVSAIVAQIEDHLSGWR